MLKFKNDAEIAKLVESVEIAEPAKNDEGNFSKLLREMVEEVLDEIEPESPSQETSQKELSCPNESTGVKFEWAIIAEALHRSGIDPASLETPGKASPACGKLWWDMGASSALETKRKKAQKAGKRFPESGLMRSSAVQALDLVEASGLIPKSSFKTADTYAGPAPESGGDPKTDITFGKGEYKVSVKMAGLIQLASSEAKSTAGSIKLALQQYMEENREQAAALIKEANEKASEKSVNEAMVEINKKLKALETQVENTTQKMMSQGYGGSGETQTPRRYVPGAASDEEFKKNYELWFQNQDTNRVMKKKLDDFHTRYKKYFNKDFNPNEAGAFVNIAAKMQAAKSGAGKGLSGEESVKKIEKMFKTVQGQVVGIADEYDWDAWEKNHKQNLIAEIATLFNNNQKFKFLIVDEELSGRRKFKDQPEAVADYILSPSYFESVKQPDPSDKGASEKYKKTIDKYAEAVVIDVRGKGRSFSQKAISYRFDINPDKIADSAAGVAAKEPLGEGKFMDWIKKGAAGIGAAWGKFKNWAGNLIGNFKNIFATELKENLIEAVDEEEVVKQIIKNPEAFFDIGGES